MFAQNSFRRHIALLLVLVFVLPLAICPVAAAENAAESPTAKAADSGDSSAKGKYLRIVRDGKDKVVALETAIVSFRPAATGRRAPARGSHPLADRGSGPGVQVDLVAAVHVADKSYYQELNKHFAGYNVVLCGSSRRKARGSPRAAARRRAATLSPPSSWA